MTLKFLTNIATLGKLINCNSHQVLVPITCCYMDNLLLLYYILSYAHSDSERESVSFRNILPISSSTVVTITIVVVIYRFLWSTQSPYCRMYWEVHLGGLRETWASHLGRLSLKKNLGSSSPNLFSMCATCFLGRDHISVFNIHISTTFILWIHWSVVLPKHSISMILYNILYVTYSAFMLFYWKMESKCAWTRSISFTSIISFYVVRQLTKRDQLHIAAPIVPVTIHCGYSLVAWTVWVQAE